MGSVRLESLCKSFGNVRVVDNVDLSIDSGEFVVFVGPSGCGKTTTLRMIAGLEDCSSGRIYIGERDVTDVHPKDRNIAMVFQSYALYPHKTVAQNLSFALQLAKVPRAEIEARIREVADILHIGDLLQRRPAMLSGGQRQRVAVGRAIVRQPEIFLFDEPLSNLDAKLRTSMRSELIKLHKKLNVTMVYVTHDQVEAMTMGDRIVVMNDGLVQQVGTPLEIYDNPLNLFVAGFIGNPAMNFVPAHVESANHEIRARLADTSLTLPRGHPAAAGSRIILGVRPEHVMIAPEQKPDLGFRAKIETIEHLGPETIIQLDYNGHMIVAKSKRQETLRTDEVVELGVSAQYIHVFDADDGGRLRTANEGNPR